VQSLDGPPALDKPGGQAIEQLRMCGAFAELAEVTDSGDDSASKMIVPDAIHHYPGGERVISIGDCFGEL